MVEVITSYGEGKMYNHLEQYNEVSCAALVSNMWQDAANVFYPRVALKELGLYRPNLGCAHRCRNQ